MRGSRAHDGRGHTFIGVPVASCVVEGCTETRTWGPPISFGVRNQIGGGVTWHSTQMGDTGPTDPTMGPYADEGEVDPQGDPFQK